MKNKWEIVHDADMDDGTPTNWVLEINHKKYGRFVWISGCCDSYDVEVDYFGDITTLITCKSLTSAKRWVTMNLL